jgi:4'-phosphopantetheinyl transferase
MLELHALDIKPMLDRPLDFACAKHLSTKIQSKVRRCINRRELNRSVWAEMFARVCIAKRLNVLNQQINIVTTVYGKPILRDFKKLHFNLAHAGAWIIVAIDVQPVGVDVEEIRTMDMLAYSDVFSQSEQNMLQVKSKESQTRCFFELWTGKESYLKAVGTGFLASENDVVIDVGEGKIFVKNSKDHLPAFVYHYPLPRSYLAAVCAFHKNFPDTVTIEEPLRVTRRFNEII